MTVVKVGNDTNILNKVDFSSGWVDRVQAMRQRNGKQFGVLRQAVDLLARTEDSWRKNPINSYIKVMLNIIENIHAVRNLSMITQIPTGLR